LSEQPRGEAAGRGLQRLPLRVAAISTAVVAIVYLVAAAALLAISWSNLVAGIDHRLTDQLLAIQAQPDVIAEISSGNGGDLDNDGDARRFESPLLVWVHGPGNTSYSSDATALLPLDLASVSGPVTATIGGVDMRLVGGALTTPQGQGWVTIAQSLGEASSATGTLLVAEVLTAPFLLLFVFLGALLIGRRVAGPLERARLAQLAFTADASHELRTPLTVIEAETSLGLQEKRTITAYQQTLVRIQDETLLLRRLVDDLLWLARFDAAPAAPPAEPIDLGALATTTVQRFTSIAGQRGTTVETSVSGRLSPVIEAPPEWIARLLSVLLDNAIGHSPPRAAVAVRISAEAARVQLSVEDNGPGIPPEERAHIFNRFHRADSEHEGAGLGLAIADAIVRSTGGHWDVGDSPAGGARMTVWWHRRAGKAFDEQSPEQADEEERSAGLSRGPSDARTRPS
jgi:two-component system sensor histidine kinase CiaH